MLRELLSNQIYNIMGHLVRWNNRLRHKNETNAIHTFYVALYTDRICLVMQRESIMIDRAHALSLALRHDIEEVITGDMPRQFKTQELTGELKRIIKEVAQANLEPEDYQMWREVQDGKSKEAQVVILADWLAGLRYMMIEARLGCKEILGNGIEFLQKDAKKIMKECPACKPFLKEINAIVEDLVNIYEHPLD